MWIGTFHSLCIRWLRAEGSAIGVAPSFVVLDTIAQQRVLRRAVERAGVVLPSWGEARQLREFGERISIRKRRGLGPDERTDPGRDTPIIMKIDQLYRHALHEAQALDYDDLILRTIQLLQEEHETASRLQQRFTHLFLDEYHDVSPEQYALISLLAPRRSSKHTIMVLADPYQSIYGWRYADASKMLARFRRDYQPQVFKLARNYRSVGHIVRAAEAVINVGTTQLRMETHHADGRVVYEKCSDDEHGEARWITEQIKRLTEAEAYELKDIAILYRLHSRTHALESALLHNGVPIDRTEEGRFFDDPDVLGTLRYLALIAALPEDSFVPALNWPRVLVDELTMAQLQRIAAQAGVGLAQLAQDLERWSDVVSPLTRATIRGFLRTVGHDLLAVADQPITTIVERLLGILAQRQQPWNADDREPMHGFLQVLGRPLNALVDQLLATMHAQRPIVLVHDGTLDAIAGCVIVEHVLDHYWDYACHIVNRGAGCVPDAFTITFGNDHVVSPHGFGLQVRDALTITYSISTQAWRLGQMLLMRVERARHEEFVVFDLETSGIQHSTAEILEVGAMRIKDGKATVPPLHSLVRPRHPIPRDATAVHGIRDVDVRDAPLPADVVPAFLDYIGDATLVGHNIMNFDHRIVHRVAAAVGAVAPTNPLIDTCELARRLLPGTSHRLADLAQRWGIQSEQAHRAMNDVQVNGAVFEHLVDLLDADKELDALGNVLAIVALGIIASGMPIDGENAVLLDAGARKHASSPSSPLIARMAELVHDQTLDQARRFIADHPRSTWEDDERWERLAEHWRGQLEQYRASAADQSLASFLRYAARAKSLDAPDMAGRVTMMTIHASKGMEWPVVFLVGAENGTLPFSNVDASRMEEERRIMYVGMTRAKERLCLTWVKSVRGRETTYSPFLDDIPAQHLRTPRRQARQ